jgi:hypothetical protein
VKESSQTFSKAVTMRYFNESDLGDYEKMVNGLIDVQNKPQLIYAVTD